MPPSANVPAEDFERVADSLKRWSTRSIDVARALLVDGESITKVAAEHNMKTQQANTIRDRFVNKMIALNAKKVSADDFMLQEQPEGEAELAPFKADLLKLEKKKFSVSQMLDFLLKNNIKTTEKILTNFLKKANRK